MAYLTIPEWELLATRPEDLDKLEFSPEQVQAQLDAVSDEADDYLRKGGYAVPIPTPSVSRALKRHLANYAYANLYDIFGRTPEGDDSLIDKNREACLAYLRMLAARELVIDAPLEPVPVPPPAPIDDVSDPLFGLGPVAYSEPQRGF
jgi:hypothetical protein